MLIAVTKVRFKIISFIFQCVKSFVVKKPACSTSFHNNRQCVFGQRNIRYPAKNFLSTLGTYFFINDKVDL
ncbi:hypothetical protein THIOM_000283 [Candidatus Thiomargarita nelsonii]|uniref:Uncharacterized protein n=1 Tax=Candidatus Thiomargarita nelsonii TaxID=1003181 RepID=A0A176S7K4_9GAMM|nr:hypothetical protein THIOM_000283 [Candidatus Thiomargarita nelsonii]